MVGSDENHPGVFRPSNFQGGFRAAGGKVTAVLGQNRRALNTLNPNIVRSSPYHCKVHKEHGITDKRTDGAKYPPIPTHRPVTRKFAAHTASKQQQATIEDEEVEMQGVEETLIVDIDSVDKKNSLAVVEYVDDIHAYYQKTERSGCAPPDYMEQQFDINERMRAIVIDWLIEVHYKFELMQETLFLTINLIDRFLAVQQVVRKNLQLVGVTATLLACKYEEVGVPVVEDLILITDKAYTTKELLDMEKSMINTLKFNLSVPTAYVFIKRFLKAAQADKKVELLSFFMTELCLVEYEMLKFPPSMLAAAAIFTAQCTLSGVSTEWCKTCEKYSNYTQDQLLECARLMVSFHQKAATGKCTGVHRKYSISKYGFVANCPPASFLLEASY